MTQFAVRSLILVLTSILAGTAIAQEPELLGRSGPSDGFLIPGNSGMANSTVDLNDLGEAVLKINSLPSVERGIWIGDGVTGDIVATGDIEWIFTDATMNDAGEAVWGQTDSPANGIYRWDPVAGSVSLWTTQPLGTSHWGTVQINQDGDVGYRATFDSTGRAWVSRTAGGDTRVHVAETALEPSSPYDFLFTPAFNNVGEIGGKALRLSGGNEIIVTDSGGNVDVRVEDTTIDPGSPFSGFDNSPAINDAGEQGFIANLAAGGRGVFRVDAGGEVTELARQGVDGVGDIEFFGPKIDNQGRVVFRAFVDGGRRAIWLADGNGPPQRLVGAGDLVDTDLGTARIDSPSGVEFSGGIDINNSGHVGFVAVLTHPDDVNNVFGLGVFRLAVATEVIFADGFEE